MQNIGFKGLKVLWIEGLKVVGFKGLGLKVVGVKNLRINTFPH
jgi:hypothetical protein